MGYCRRAVWKTRDGDESSACEARAKWESEITEERPIAVITIHKE